MEVKYTVKSRFAIDSEIYNVGDVVQMKAEDAQEYTKKGMLEEYKEDHKVTVEVDQKGITQAIEAGFAKFAPKQTQEPEKKLGFGEFLQGIAKKTINITTGNQGGNQTESLLDPNVDVDLIRESGVAAKANLVSLTGQNNQYKFNVVSSIGTAPAIFAESATITASQPVITNFSVSLSKCAYRYDATDEALEDTGALATEVSGALVEEFNKFIEQGMIVGNTAFTGVAGDTNTVTVAKESGQTDGTIVSENIDKMFSSVKNASRSVWVMSRSAYTAIQGLEDSAGHRIFQGPNGIGDAPFGTLKGLPIMVSDYCRVIGNNGDILLGDWSKYKLVTKGGLKALMSSHVSFLEDEHVFKFTYRIGGLPFGIKQTAADGTEISDFVELADRGSF